MSKRSTFLVASWLFVLATGMSAQGRFEVLAQNAVAEVPDLRNPQYSRHSTVGVLHGFHY